MNTKRKLLPPMAVVQPRYVSRSQIGRSTGPASVGWAIDYECATALNRRELRTLPPKIRLACRARGRFLSATVFPCLRPSLTCFFVEPVRLPLKSCASRKAASMRIVGHGKPSRQLTAAHRGQTTSAPRR